VQSTVITSQLEAMYHLLGDFHLGSNVANASITPAFYGSYGVAQEPVQSSIWVGSNEWAVPSSTNNLLEAREFWPIGLEVQSLVVPESMISS
jgi:hypothetical protein